MLQEMRSELRKVDSTSISTLVSPKGSSINDGASEGQIPSGGSDFQRRNLSGGSQNAPEHEFSHFENYPMLQRGM